MQRLCKDLSLKFEIKYSNNYEIFTNLKKNCEYYIVGIVTIDS